MSRPSAQPDRGQYVAPALDKGLDILELLALEGHRGYTQKTICDKLDKSQSEIYRMLACLESRGYLQRGPQDDLYRLSAKLFELAHAHPPTRRLIDVALPIMRRFAELTEQSCHLVVHQNHRAVVIVQADSPQFVAVHVRPGANLPVHETVSGRVLAAFAPDDLREVCLKKVREQLSAAKYKKLIAVLDRIRADGHDQAPSTVVSGILDLSVPVLNHHGQVVAALSSPCLIPPDRPKQKTIDFVLHHMKQAAQELARAIGAGDREQQTAPLNAKPD